MGYWMKKQRYTLHDVARVADVSYQTVSRVINEHPSVADDTRARVQRIIAELGYQPNMVAKSLAANRSSSLAVLTFGMIHYGPSQMILNIERTAKDLGYDLIFSNVREPSYAGLRKAIDNVNSRQVEGIIAISPVVGISYDEIASLCQGVPLVQIDPEIGLEVPSVVVEQRAGSQLVTYYLTGLGHQRLTEISGPLNWFGAVARHEAWEAALQSAGLTPMMSVEGDWTAHSGYEAVQKLLARDPGFTAIVVANDQMALGAIYALHEKGLRVPEDVSVVGFDDIPEAAYFRPALTTVQQDFNQLGEMSVRYLLELIESSDTPLRQYRLYPKLIVRDSTASPG
jgi:DNA-binding LacI/PurR family transcriptional regulator